MKTISVVDRMQEFLLKAKSKRLVSNYNYKVSSKTDKDYKIKEFKTSIVKPTIYYVYDSALRKNTLVPTIGAPSNYYLIKLQVNVQFYLEGKLWILEKRRVKKIKLVINMILLNIMIDLVILNVLI